MASIGFTGIGPLLDGVKGVANTLLEVNKIPQQQIILAAYAQMSEMQRTIYDLDDKLRAVTKELERIRPRTSSLTTVTSPALWMGGRPTIPSRPLSILPASCESASQN